MQYSLLLGTKYRFLKCSNFQNSNAKLNFLEAKRASDYRILIMRKSRDVLKMWYVHLHLQFILDEFTYYLLFLIYIQYSLFKVVTTAVRLNQGSLL